MLYVATLIAVVFLARTAFVALLRIARALERVASSLERMEDRDSAREREGR